MKILAIETSTEACSVALLHGTECRERFQMAPQQHGDLVLPMVEVLLQESGLTLRQLDAIAFGRGPGSFTGVRIATAVAQGLGYAADLPLLPVSTLAILAQGGEGTHLLAAIDARMNEVYWGCFVRNGAGLVERQGEEMVCSPSQVPVPEGTSWHGVGTGWDSYGAILEARLTGHLAGIDPGALPHAAAAARLAVSLWDSGAAVVAAEAQPVYIRDQVAWRKPGS